MLSLLGTLATKVQVLPDPIDITFVPAVAGIGAGVFVLVALLIGAGERKGGPRPSAHARGRSSCQAG